VKDNYFKKLSVLMQDRVNTWESMKKEPELTDDNDIISIYKKRADKRMN